jgi:hypothetical protein
MSLIYRYPKSVYDAVNSQLPRRMTFGVQCQDDAEMYYIYADTLSKFVKDNINLNTISIAMFGDTFDNYFEQYKVFPYKIYSLLKNPDEQDDLTTPKDIDFKSDLTISLQKKTLPKVQGKPTAVEYYEKKYYQTDENGLVLDATGNPVVIYENIICRIDFQLSYDPLGFISSKIAMLQWYREDGSVDYSTGKDLGKLYDPVLDHEARIMEGKQRRQAIVDGLQLPVLGILFMIYPTKSQLEVLSIGREFLNRLDEDFRDFVEKSLSVTDPEDPNFGRKVILVKIEEQPDPWLDVDLGGFTLRAMLLAELDTSSDVEV